MLEELGSWPWKAILTSATLFTVIGSGVGYLLRRRIERTGESEELDKLHRTVDLHKKLREQQISVDELKLLRGQVTQKELQAATDTAQFFLNRAERLASAPTGIEVTHSSAVNRSDGTQAEINAYAAQQLDLADIQLQETVAAERATMDAEMRVVFDEAQTAWVAWRDRESLLEGRVWEGGSIRPLIVASKREAMTRARMADLQLLGSKEEPRIVPSYPSTPLNILDHVTPGVSCERVREMLGAPHYADTWAWTYRFAEAQLYIVVKEERVREVSLAMVHGHCLTMDFIHFDLVLGRATLADLQAAAPDTVLQARFSARTNEVYATTRVGHSSAWRTFFFGSLVPLGPHGLLLPTSFDWNVDEDRLDSNSKETLINWVGLSDDEHPPSFAWFITP